MIVQKTSFLRPFIIITFAGEAGDTLILKNHFPMLTDDKVGVTTDFINVDGEWKSPDDRKTWWNDAQMVLSNCVHIITEGNSITYKGIDQYIKNAGDGGWFYMPKDVVNLPITCDMYSMLMTITTEENSFIHNRTVHNLNDQTVTINPSTEKQKYVLVATGDVTVNGTINVSALKLLKLSNPATITANRSAILIELEL